MHRRSDLAGQREVRNTRPQRFTVFVQDPLRNLLGKFLYATFGKLDGVLVFKSTINRANQES